MPFNLSFRNFHNYTYPEHHGRLDTHKNVVRSDGDSFSICVCARRAADPGVVSLLQVWDAATQKWVGYLRCTPSIDRVECKPPHPTTILPGPGLHSPLS